MIHIYFYIDDDNKKTQEHNYIKVKLFIGTIL